MRTPLTVLIPAKHEPHTIVSTLESLRRAVHTPHRTIVVNVSDEKDTTAALVKRYIRTHPQVRLVRKIHPHGTFGMAIALGLKTVASGAVVPFMADVCDDPKDIDRMYARLKKGWDIVAASRYMRGGKKTGGPAVQSFFSRLVCISLQILTGVPTSDVSNAFKMYNAKLFKNVTVSPTSGVEASMEITLQAYFNGAKITEIPTVWRGRTAGKSKFKILDRAPKYIRIYLWAVFQRLHPKSL